MKTILSLAGILTMTMACASTTPPEGEPPTESGNPGAAACDASKAQHLVGQAGTEELAAEAKRLSGASTVRFLRPGQIVTMEYLDSRLNVQVDEQNKVIAIRCG
jgi:hypothetical protein